MNTITIFFADCSNEKSNNIVVKASFSFVFVTTLDYLWRI